MSPDAATKDKVCRIRRRRHSLYRPALPRNLHHRHSGRSKESKNRLIHSTHTIAEPGTTGLCYYI